MKHFRDDWVKEWCDDNGWTDLFRESYMYWAFPPNAVMPEPIPPKTLRLIKSEKGLCPEEKALSLVAILITVVAISLSYYWHCPMPLMLAFGFWAIAVTQLEVEDF